MAATTGARGAEALSARGRRAIWGAFLGFFVDMFDVYLPIVVLAPAIGYFVSPNLPESTTGIVEGMVFATALIGRPIGAFIFGRYGDMIGRRRTAMIAVSGFGVTTLLMAVLPGYEQWGIGAVIVFIALRLVDGIFLGGEYTSASPLAMEYSPRARRGLYGALIMTGFPLAYVVISLLTFLILSVVPAGSLDSPYVQWGWRIPFFIGAAIAFAFVAYYYFSVSESELWEASGRNESPIRTLFSGDNLRHFLQVFVMMSGFWLAVNTVSAILPGTLGSRVGLSSTEVSATLIVVFLVAAVGYVGAGVISQRIGRRLFLMLMGIAMAIGGTFFYYLLVSLAPKSLWAVIILAAIIAVLSISNWGLATTYINERFHTSIRASGFGLGYSLAVILPSFYAFYQAGLSNFMSAEYTPLVFLVVSGILILVGAALGPETRDVDFSEDVPEPVRSTVDAGDLSDTRPAS